MPGGYYDGPDLTAVVADALAAAGRPGQVEPDDLAALDEFHALGRPATLALADLAQIRPGERLLDVGAGIGGPSPVLGPPHRAPGDAGGPARRLPAAHP